MHHTCEAESHQPSVSETRGDERIEFRVEGGAIRE
jgi:hypothetical protein